VRPGRLTTTPSEELLRSFARQLLDQGIAVARIAVFVRTLHPNVAGRAFFWRDDREDVEADSADHEWLDSADHKASPIYAVWREGKEIRRRVEDPGCPMDFPVLPDLRAEGMTDYLALPLHFLSGEIHVATFATRSPGGFSDRDLETLHGMLPPFTRIAEITALSRKARNILDAYLGHQAGEKVLAGHIKRGDGEEIRAVIWFCDLRDSTPLADSMSRQAFLGLLNDYFEAVLGPVEARRGEILRFIGDAALAIFPIGNDPAAIACANALAAAREAMARMDELNRRRKAEGQRSLRFGIGLHLGLVLYGNIGTPNRIEFTVIGAAANEAARIESLCKSLGVDLILSEHVARHLTERPRSLGKHSLRGVGEPIELFAG
jgi:adenylate cyclase